MYCPKCGTENHDNNFKCTHCQAILHPSGPPVDGVFLRKELNSHVLPEMWCAE
jgi:hypothetical protein